MEVRDSPRQSTCISSGRGLMATILSTSLDLTVDAMIDVEILNYFLSSSMLIAVNFSVVNSSNLHLSPFGRLSC